MMMTMGIVDSIPTAGGSSSTTWNPADKDPDVTLSSGNLAATATTVGGVRSVHGSSGLLYYEAQWNVAILGGFGVGNISANINDDLSNDGNGISIWEDGRVYNPSDVGGYGSPTTGDIICIAVDVPNKRFWARVNNGNWNNSGTANPATNTGGYAFSYSGANYAFASPYGSSVLLKPGAADWTYTPPSGFSAIV